MSSAYAQQFLTNYIAWVLIISAVVFWIAEIHLPSGALGILGVIAFIFGAFFMLQKGSPNYALTLSLIISIGVIIAGIVLIIANLALRAHRRPVVTGQEELIQSVAEVVRQDREYLEVRLRGELWQAKSDEQLQPGQKVVVTGREGMVLLVASYHP